MMRLEMSMVPIMRMPMTMVTAVSRAMSVLSAPTRVPVARGKGLVEGNGEHAVVKEDEDGQHRHTQGDGDDHVRIGKGQYLAKEIVADLAHALGHGDDDGPDRHGGGGKHGDGRVALDARALVEAQKHEGRRHHYGDGHDQRREIRRRGNAQGAEAPRGRGRRRSSNSA